MFYYMDRTTLLLCALVSLSWFAFRYIICQRRVRNLALYNAPQPWWSSRARKAAKERFITGAREILQEALEGDVPFRVFADVGEIIVLPSRYASEIRNNEDLSFTMAAHKWFYADLPGLEGFREGTRESHLIRTVAQAQLTLYLSKITKEVSDECGAALTDMITTDNEWNTVTLTKFAINIMSRISGRVFLGKELCRDPEWLRITRTYAVIAFRAVEELRTFPHVLRPLVQWFLPNCTAARRLVQDARHLMAPVLDRRREDKEAALARGQKFPADDAIEWLEDTAVKHGFTYDAACAQLSISVAALHSTTDFFSQALMDIAHHRELIEPLRDEIRSVLGKEDWSKKTLYELKLMDSVLKESQRLKPIALASLRRYLTSELTLSDGIVLPKGYLVLTSVDQHWNPENYEDPHTFDGYRFLKMRQQPGKENSSQLVSVTHNFIGGFGYGVHACPGRFFASEEVKIFLAHFLMKYDFELVPGDVSCRKFGLSMNANPKVQIKIRKREESYTL